MNTIEELKNDKNLMVDFINFFFGFKLYPYQIKFLNYCLNYNRIAGKWARQSGKSQSVAIYTLMRSILEKVTVIVVAPTQNQSTEMFLKIRDLAFANPDINSLIKRNTKTELIFVNGSRIISLPCGPEGRTIRGYTCDILVVEEAGVMEDTIVNSVLTPMIASKGSKGQIIKIGTPLLRNHFYRSCFEDTNYKVVNVTWEDALKVGQYSKEFIEEQKASLTDIEFRTEYSSEFIDSGMMFFNIDILKQCMINYKLMPEF